MSFDSVRVNRRVFLMAASGLGVAAAVAKYFPHLSSLSDTNETSILRGGGFNPGALYHTGSRYHLSSEYRDRFVFELDLSNLKLRHTTTGTAVHVVETHPFDRDLSILATKRTDKMSLFDWGNLKQVSEHRLENNEFFYGHAVFSDDGKLLLATTFNANTSQSSIGVFEVPGLKKIASIATGGGTAHELCPLGKNKFVFGHVHEDAMSFSTIDLTTHEVQSFPTEFRTTQASFLMTHLKNCGDRFIANINVINAKTESVSEGALVSFHKTTNTTKTEIALGSSGFLGEMLSLDYDPSTKFAWITLPSLSQVKVWDLRSDSLVGTLDLEGEQSNGVSNATNSGLTIVTTRKRFFVFDSKTLKRQESIEAQWPHEILADRFCAHTRII